MSLGESDIAFAAALFSDIPNLTTRKMFGGLGLYSDGVIFALMRSDGQLLLKAQPGAFEDRLAEMGAAKWTYTRKNGAVSSMPYWTLPEDALDDPALANELAGAAINALR
ncbi:MAG: TfoX/Sxy family protein [Sulfitobacter sp.]